MNPAMMTVFVGCLTLLQVASLSADNNIGRYRVTSGSPGRSERFVRSVKKHGGNNFIEEGEASTDAGDASPANVAKACTQCTDNPTPWMKNNDKPCSTGKHLWKKCYKNKWWITNKFCQQSCYNAGNGYDDDECCEATTTTAPATTTSQVTTTTTPCVDDDAGLAARKLRWVAGKRKRRYDIHSCAVLAGINKSAKNLCASPLYQEDAQKYCCHTCKSAPVRIIFGGGEHSQNNWGTLERPEATRSEHCTSAECFECSTETNCWHGLVQDVTTGPGNMGIDVQPNSGFASFAYSVYATCPSGDGTWMFSLHSCENAKLKIFINGVLSLTLDEDDQRTRQKRTFHEKKLTITEKSHIRVVLTPDDPSLESHAMLKVMAKGVAVSTDDCLSVKDCLSILGDGTPASFTLRNVNEVQLKCLQKAKNPAIATTMTQDLLHKCDEWLDCLDPAQVQSLEVLLLAAGVGASNQVLAAGVQAHNSTEVALGASSQDPNECIDPVTQDPESWDCECFENIQAACGGVANGNFGTYVVCIRDRMCLLDKICGEWKNTHCSAASVEVSADGSLMDNEKSAQRGSEQNHRAIARRAKAKKDRVAENGQEASFGNESLHTRKTAQNAMVRSQALDGRGNNEAYEAVKRNVNLDETVGGKCA